MNLILDKWNSPRLTISDLKEDEIPVVQDLYETSQYMNQWDGQSYNPEHIKDCLFNGNLPPGGKLENYRIQTIRNKEDQKIIGILSVYHGYPSTDSVYLEFLYIDKNIQKQGFGQEVIHQFAEVTTALGYKEIRINVAVKNWPALKFWIKSGFNHASGIYGDNEFSETTYANLELVKIL
ncbi:GNAT family N-acetyltransferase [Saccharibacillus brassicae]|uniref:GNAT family N-acetyltransferase n=1 Tax=Saccharibacillus brassicae TaxID=2583377 RepID=A0A4Y6URW4_SACBS|nr:GNAT family N-acetyltransferase [Saccharibacillus brassicae]QDH20369.1 GNAT family N-acetyltransferase [Saccharibacillus brassicae]